MSAVNRPALLALALVAAVFVADLNIPLGVAAAVPYAFAVLLALRCPAGWFAPAVAAVCGVLTVAKMGLAPDRGTTELWKVVANRGLALFAIGMTAALGLRQRRAEAERAAAEERVREQLADLARMGRLASAGQLATGLAHELNQPLAAVCLQAEVVEQLADRGATTAELLPTLREIGAESRRAADIVRGLRRMLRREDPHPGPVDLGAVVETVRRLVAVPARRGGVEVRLEVADVPPVRGDRVQLEQVVFNLVQNAVEATAAAAGRREVVVRVAPDGIGWAGVSVRDTGVGLPPGDPDQVFEQFFTTKPDGMGVGLPLCRSIVEAHGGRLTAAPAAGRGAVFRLVLPTAEGRQG